MPRGTGRGSTGRGRGRGRGRGGSAPYERTPAQRIAAADASRRHAWRRVFEQSEEITSLYSAISTLSKSLDANKGEWNIPQHHINDFKKLLEGKEHEYECPICFDSLVTGQLYFTPKCFHKFHAGCVEQQPPVDTDHPNSRKCALCREEFVFRKPPVFNSSAAGSDPAASAAASASS
jgi:hypothetical protein